MLTLETLSRSSKVRSRSNPSPLVEEIFEDGNNTLWQDKYEPNCIPDLPIPIKKVDELRIWLDNALRRYKCSSTEEYHPDILLLCGCSGCCKSSMVKVLCKDMGIGIIEWSDDSVASESVAFNPLSTQTFPSLPIDLLDLSGGNRDSRSGMSADIEDFALRSSYPSLDTTTRDSFGNPIRARTPPLSLPSFGNKTTRAGVMAATKSTPRRPEHDSHIVLVHDPASLAPRLKVDVEGDEGQFRDTERDKDGIVPILQRFRHPVVLVVSDVSGRDDMHFAVDSIVPKHLRSRQYLIIETVGRAILICYGSVNVDMLYCNPITAKKVHKVLSKIAELEMRSFRRQQMSVSLQPDESLKSPPPPLLAPSSSVLEGISESCMGDLRHAISQLQMLMIGSSHVLTQSKPSRQSSTSKPVQRDKGGSRRDSSYSSLHGISKLLRAKLDDRYILAMDPDVVIRGLDLPVEISLSFLQHNCLAILDDMSRRARMNKMTAGSTHSLSSGGDVKNGTTHSPQLELDALQRYEYALQWYSDADLFVARKYSTSLPLDRSDNSFPMDQVECMASRASLVSGYMTSWTEGGGKEHWLRKGKEQQMEEEASDSLEMPLSAKRGWPLEDTVLTGKKRARPKEAIGGTEAELVDLCSSGDEAVRPPLSRAPSSSMGGTGSMIPIYRPKSMDIRRAASVTIDATVALRTALSLPVSPQTSDPSALTSPRAAPFTTSHTGPLHMTSSNDASTQLPLHQPLLSTSEVALSVTPFLKFISSPATYSAYGRTLSHPYTHSQTTTGNVLWHPVVKACVQNLLSSGDGVVKSFVSTQGGSVRQNMGLQTEVSNIIEVDEDIDGFSD